MAACNCGSQDRAGNKRNPASERPRNSKYPSQRIYMHKIANKLSNGGSNNLSKTHSQRPCIKLKPSIVWSVMTTLKRRPRSLLNLRVDHDVDCGIAVQLMIKTLCGVEADIPETVNLCRDYLWEHCGSTIAAAKCTYWSTRRVRGSQQADLGLTVEGELICMHIDVYIPAWRIKSIGGVLTQYQYSISIFFS